MNASNLILKSCRKAYRIIARPHFVKPECEYDREIANQKIYDLLTGDRACMISRLGTTELNIILNYQSIKSKKSFLKKSFEFITSDIGLPVWNENCFHYCERYSGIFPPTKDILSSFSELYLQDVQDMDLIGSFQSGEKKLPLRKDLIYVHLEMLYPFFVKKPWTRALRGKKILVVHPFEDTIRSQFNYRKLLFDNSDILPDFELYTLRAVQTLGGGDNCFGDWFEALHYMEQQIDKIDFDICLLGCGAYGLPLAAYIKRSGKKAFHIGGGLQLLFGIRGKRWDNNGYHGANLTQIDTNYSRLYNDNWVRASESETPKIAQKVEGACYW